MKLICGKIITAGSSTFLTFILWQNIRNFIVYAVFNFDVETVLRKFFGFLVAPFQRS